MNCKSPVSLKFKRGKDNNPIYVKNAVTGLTYNGALVPCGKCINCKIAKSKEWALRCCLELPYWNDSIFVTLTYDDDHLPENASLRKKDLQDFFKRLRRDLEPMNIKYFACGEYGDNNTRPHYHAIIYGVGLDLENYDDMLKCYRSAYSLIEQNWTSGNVFNGVVTYNSARYCAEYVFKKYDNNVKKKEYDDLGLEVPFQIQSNGIGLSWFNDYAGYIWQRGYIYFNGVKHSIPRYFVDKMKELNKEKFTELMAKCQVSGFDSWYKDYINDLSKLLCCTPKEVESSIVDSPLPYFNEMSIRQSHNNYLKALSNEKKAKVFGR